MFSDKNAVGDRNEWMEKTLKRTLKMLRLGDMYSSEPFVATSATAAESHVGEWNAKSDDDVQ